MMDATIKRLLWLSPLAFLLSGCGISAVEALGGATALVVGSELQKEGVEPLPPKGERTMKGFANQFRDNVKLTSQKVEEWWLTPLPSTDPLPLAPSYCYRVQQDVLCYRQPMPGWEHRLAGYQGTGAQPPAPATMQLLPVRTLDSSKLAVNRLAAAKPVFVQLPPDAKEAPKDPTQPSTVDASTDPLPDPVLSPQL
jgi:hypothetical protein